MFISIFSVLAVFILSVSALLCRDKQNASILVEYGPDFICCGTATPIVNRGMKVGCCGSGNTTQLYYTKICECKDGKIKPKTQDSSVDSSLGKDDCVPKKSELQLKERLTTSVCRKRFGLRYCEHAKTCYYPKKQLCCEDGIHIGKGDCLSMHLNHKFGTANNGNKRNVSDEAYKHVYELLVKILHLLQS